MKYNGKIQKTEVPENRAWSVGDKKYTGTFQLSDQRPLFQSQSQLVQLAKDAAEDAAKEALIKSYLRVGCGYLYPSIEREVEDIFQAEEGRIMLSWDEKHICSLPWQTEAVDILRHPQVYTKKSFRAPNPPMVMDADRHTVTFPVASPAEITQTFICAGHLLHITEVCKSSGHIIVVREAGELSLKRMQEGASPKPHTVLDKSVSRKRMKDMVDQMEIAPSERKAHEKSMLDKYGGFVGKWDERGVLQGLILVNDPQKKKILNGILKAELSAARIVLNPDTSNESLPLELVDILRNERQDWQSFFYTGDYDLHEVYDKRNFQIPEATLEKRRLLNKLNAGLVEGYIPVDTNPSDAGLSLHPIHMPDSRAPFQHGDQAVYRMNQVLEGESLKSPRIELVRPVAIADTGRLAWCVRGTWYITEGLEMQKKLRAELGLTAPSTWEEDEQADTSKTKTHYRDKQHPDGKRTQRFE